MLKWLWYLDAEMCLLEESRSAVNQTATNKNKTDDFNESPNAMHENLNDEQIMRNLNADGGILMRIAVAQPK